MIENRNKEIIIPSYTPLPWYKNIVKKTRDGITNYIKNYKFPWKKLIILLLFGLIILGIYLAVILNQIDVPVRAPYDKTGFIEAEEYIKTNSNQTVLENDSYKFTFDNKKTTFVVLDKLTGQEYHSNPVNSSARFLDTMVVYYSESLGASTPMSVYEKAVAFNDFYIRLDDNSIEVLYEVGGKKEVDKSDFPELINDDRMQEKILSHLDEGSSAYRRVTESCYVEGNVNGVKVWKLKDGIQTHILNQLYEIFYEDAGYTKEDLQYDLELNGIVYEDKYPYIEVAIKYTLTDKGIDIELINDSIFEKEKYPLLYIDILPYFATATLTDTGYTLVPDGSGALIDFNNNRSFALAYNQRIYGKEKAVIREVMENKSENLSLPLYGMKINDGGFINIAQTGAEMASILANVSTVDNPYNQAYYRYHFRESEVFKFTSINSKTNIVQWTPWYNTEDFKAKIIFVHEDEASYTGMAKTYQRHLVEEGILYSKDNTTNVTLDLTLLGGYLVDENFIGIPYTTLRSLTNTSQAKEIVSKLLDDGISDINLIYKGWSNDGLKPTYIGKIEYDRATGSKSALKDLQEYLNNQNINFYPEVYVNTAYTKDNFDEKDDAVRNVFGKIVVNHDYNEAILYSDFSTLGFYTLKPTTFSSTLNKVIKGFKNTNFENIAFNDFGSGLYGSYHKKDTLFRSDTLDLFESAASNNLYNFDKILFRNPSLYALKYTDVATDIPTTTTNYQIVGLSVPFYQLVLSGYIDYSSRSFNLEDKYTYDWNKMKAIETASNISLTWSYESTINLAETEYSYYYSTYYNNWYERAVQTYQELNSLNIYNTYLVKHEIIKADGSITKSTYANGTEIMFNYGISNYNYKGNIIQPNNYKIVKEAN